MDDLGDEKEGRIGAGGSPDGLWQWWPAAVVVEEDPFRFFNDSTIGVCFS